MDTSQTYNQDNLNYTIDQLCSPEEAALYFPLQEEGIKAASQEFISHYYPLAPPSPSAIEEDEQVPDAVGNEEVMSAEGTDATMVMQE